MAELLDNNLRRRRSLTSSRPYPRLNAAISKLPANGSNVRPDIMKSGAKDKRENHEVVGCLPSAFASFLRPRQQCLTCVRDHLLPRRSAVLPETSALAAKYGI